MISLQSKGLSRVFLQYHSSKKHLFSAFFIVQLGHSYMPTGRTIALTIQAFVGKVLFLIFTALLRQEASGPFLSLRPGVDSWLVTWCRAPGGGGKVQRYFIPALSLQCSVHLGLSRVAFSVLLPIPLMMLKLLLDSGVLWWGHVSCSFPSGSRSLLCVSVRFWTRGSDRPSPRP